MRSMGTKSLVGNVLAILACLILSACLRSVDGGAGDCVSYYDPVASAPTWRDLEDAMLETTDWGRVASVRTQARGDDVGAGDEKAERITHALGAPEAMPEPLGSTVQMVRAVIAGE